jgi:uncharacterized lipoprotein NlpE involved in copper resistance
MKRIILALAATLALAGCDTFVRKEVVVETHYVVRKATDQQKALPPYPAPLNVATADQLSLADWIAQSEKRQYDLESIIKRLVEYYEQAPTPEEKAAAPAAPASAASAAK